VSIITYFKNLHKHISDFFGVIVSKFEYQFFGCILTYISSIVNFYMYALKLQLIWPISVQHGFMRLSTSPVFYFCMKVQSDGFTNVQTFFFILKHAYSWFDFLNHHFSLWLCNFLHMTGAYKFTFIATM
jgi:hypothetical protein